MIDGPEAWFTIPSLNFEGHCDYMWIGLEERHLVSTTTAGVDPLRMFAIPVHFRLTDPGTVEVRRAGEDAWTAHPVRRDGDMWWWTIRGKEHGWRQVDAGSVPQQARDVIARGRERLRKSDADGGGAAS